MERSDIISYLKLSLSLKSTNIKLKYIYQAAEIRFECEITVRFNFSYEQ